MVYRASVVPLTFARKNVHSAGHGDNGGKRREGRLVNLGTYALVVFSIFEKEPFRRPLIAVFRFYSACVMTLSWDRLGIDYPVSSFYVLCLRLWCSVVRPEKFATTISQVAYKANETNLNGMNWTASSFFSTVRATRLNWHFISVQFCSVCLLTPLELKLWLMKSLRSKPWRLTDRIFNQGRVCYTQFTKCGKFRDLDFSCFLFKLERALTG